MSLLDAAGWALSRCQSVSVVPMIQCRPQGMTNSTDFSVRRIRPTVDWKRSRGTTRWMPLEARTLSWPRSVTMAWVSSVQTPVALMTCLARMLKLEPSSWLTTLAPTTRSPSRRKSTTAIWFTACAP